MFSFCCGKSHKNPSTKKRKTTNFDIEIDEGDLTEKSNAFLFYASQRKKDVVASSDYVYGGISAVDVSDIHSLESKALEYEQQALLHMKLRERCKTIEAKIFESERSLKEATENLTRRFLLWLLEKRARIVMASSYRQRCFLRTQWFSKL